MLSHIPYKKRKRDTNLSLFIYLFMLISFEFKYDFLNRVIMKYKFLKCRF